MILCIDTFGTHLDGLLCRLPQGWKDDVAPWAFSECRKNNFGTSLIQKLQLSSCSIYIWKLQIEESVTLYPMATAPTIALQFTLTGNIDCTLTGYGKKLLRHGTAALFYVPGSVHEARFEPGIYESLHIELTPDWLQDISIDNNEVSELVQAVHVLSETGIPMLSVKIGYIMQAIIRNLRECRKTNGQLKLEIHKYVLELLSEYFEGLESERQEHEVQYTPYRDILIRIRDYILRAPDIQQHTLGKLARHFHLSESILRNHFQKIFLMSLSAFVRLHALRKASYLITETLYSIEEISVEVGYSSREALERAFKKQYGCSPSKKRLNQNG